MADTPTLAQRFSDHFKRGRQAPHQLCEYWVGVDGETGELGAEWADKPHRLVFDLLYHAVFQENEIENLRRQIAELRAQVDVQRQSKEYAQRCCEAAEAENARLRALPLKDEVERVLERAKKAFESDTLHDKAAALLDVDALLSRLRAGVQDRDGLSEWAGWDKSRDPWGETKHKDAVLEALFRGPWSVEDAAALIGFIDRTWTKRPASPSISEGGSRP